MIAPRSKTPSLKTILCVEDDVDTCEVLTILLREYQFECLNTVASAIPVLQTKGADLYILDNWLPDGSGVDLCRKIREIYPTTPIIFTSAAGRTSDIDEAIGAGANRYLLKPCEPETLREIVKELLN